MIVTSSIVEARDSIRAWKGQGYTIGLVPTMGSLHQGHHSLIKQAGERTDKVVVSIFVNPLQFGPDEDFDRYPRSLTEDLRSCEAAGADLVFTPECGELLPEGNLIHVDVDRLGDSLCGRSRPGHFRGVCTIVAKLFNILTPDEAFFGEKDAQQLAIIGRMAKDLNFDVEIVPCPIMRDTDGLAMSSRNSYLSLDERKAARVLSRSLREVKVMIETGERNPGRIREFISATIQAEPLASIDYIEIVNPHTMLSLSKIEYPLLVAVAVYFGRTRLIDNFTYKEKEDGSYDAQSKNP